MQDLSEKREIKIGKIYRHFKGTLYRVISICTHTESGEVLVVYEQVNDEGKVWARPYEMYNSLVDKEKYPDNKQKYRFEEIGE
ncbi:MAG: DUF1653 domain-containing protein [Clostridia bacterium]|nr:DUF1653 domain-containing protein [Clostridia bacterium]MBQ7788290.1 DUF1653 domain-containing protein [Clostridia bacterium]